MKISKKAIGANMAYDRSTIGDVREAYKNPSDFKKAAFDAIWYEMLKLGGHDLRIIGANTSYFSCAYVLGDNLIYHTYKNRYEYHRIVEE